MSFSETTIRFPLPVFVFNLSSRPSGISNINLSGVIVFTIQVEYWGTKKEIFRLSLTETTGRVIKNGLFLLGIAAPEKM
ncbi:hypothetical protein A2691_01490 [Candidatus Woesebacteria bacterium RIFCSPHIGHO2_01_FULL_39_23]|nr:MAG: hypothetical protein A2691_01490 [Candidatus Woesebacteria bacterium RIFCSPHIGHO2_01_FULL_39_23]